MKIHFIMAVLVIVLGYMFQISTTEWLICIICFGMVISGELINTAIEALVDLVSPKKNDLARKAKDVAAGAVLFSAFCAAIIGLIIFLPKMLTLLTQITHYAD